MEKYKKDIDTQMNLNMQTNYSSPELFVEEVVVEYGFAITNDYGQSGEAGGDIGENDYGGF